MELSQVTTRPVLAFFLFFAILAVRPVPGQAASAPTVDEARAALEGVVNAMPEPLRSYLEGVVKDLKEGLSVRPPEKIPLGIADGSEWFVKTGRRSAKGHITPDKVIPGFGGILKSSSPDGGMVR